MSEKKVLNEIIIHRLTYHIIYRFHPPPTKIELVIDTDSDEAHFSGTYLLGASLVNEKPFWSQQNGSHAIWSHEVLYGSVWIIGDLSQLGRFHGKIFVNADKNNTYPNASLPVTFKDIGMHKLEL